MEPDTRAALIASYQYGQTALADAPPPPAAKPAPDPAKPAPSPDATEPAGDGSVTAKIAAAKTAVAEAIQAQDADPDSKTDPADAAVMADLQNAAAALDKADKDQQVDVAGAKAPKAPEPAAPADPAAPAQTAAGAVPPVKLPPPAAKGAPPKNAPVPAKGDQDPDTECADPSCAHPASVHENTGEGDNVGACTTPGCDCAGLTVAANAAAETPGQVEDPEAEGVKLAGDLPMPPASPVLPVMPVEPAGATTESNPPPTIPGSDNIGPAFTIPVGVIEGQPTGDGREIAPNALTWRPPPMPLMLMKTSAHDPSGMSPNDPAVIAGRIDTLERTPGENGTQIITAKGYFLLDEHGTYAASLTEQMGRVGISADIAAQDEEISGVEVDETGMPTDMVSTLLEGVIMGFTMLPFPAFAACYIVLGDGQMAADPIPMEAETASGQMVHWMTFEECASCDAGNEVLVAAGGPVRPPSSWFSAPGFQEDDGRLQEVYGARGRTALGCPLTITEDGRVYGHIALWGACHIGHAGKCITPPRSQTDYAHFKRGEVLTADGEYIRVGVITADTGHAGLQLAAGGAMAHYDDTGTVTAFVNAGEDDYGIWVAGSIDPDATDSQVQRLRACGVSGDWRNRELVAALSVPTPGYPLARVRGRQEALVASGAKVMYLMAHPEEADDTDPGVDRALRASLAPLVEQSGAMARGRILAAQADRARKRITSRR